MSFFLSAAASRRVGRQSEAVVSALATSRPLLRPISVIGVLLAAAVWQCLHSRFFVAQACNR